MKNKTVDVEVSLNDILTVPDDPPRSNWCDWLPNFVVFFFRTRFGFPKISPLERWLLLHRTRSKVLMGLLAGPELKPLPFTKTADKKVLN